MLGRKEGMSQEPEGTPPSPTEQWSQEAEGLGPGRLCLDRSEFAPILHCESLEENVVSGCPCAPSTWLRAKY